MDNRSGRIRIRRFAICFACLIAAAARPASAQSVSGMIFEDRNANGLLDPGESPFPGVRVLLAGTQSGGAPLTTEALSDIDGLFNFAPGDGTYLLAPVDPPGWRLGPARSDGFPISTPGYLHPIGRPRFSKVDRGIANLADGAFRMTVLGDSIALNFNICFDSQDFWYSEQVLDRLGATAPAAALSLDGEAFTGSHTDDLHDPTTGNYARDVLALDPPPDLVTLSLIGNDLLGQEPSGTPIQADINRIATELIDSRANLQEALAAFVSEIPGADIALNTLYDNEAEDCATSTVHREWIPILNRILRDLAWGQARRVSINEIAAEFAHVDQQNACTGFQGQICEGLFGLDQIHPTASGYSIVREKVWEAVGGVSLGTGDALGRASIDGIEYGYLRRVARLLPTAWEIRDGAVVENAAGATSDQDQGSGARIALGAGSEEFRLFGFPSWFDEIAIVRVIAGVRYHTTGAVADDAYRMEASVTGQFRAPPGHDYTPTSWNFYTPLVGAGGPNQPEGIGDYPSAEPLIVPDVPDDRDVSATLTRNPALPEGAAEYTWPAVTHADLATTTIRVAAAPIAGTIGNDNYRIDLDYAWLDLYGWEKPRPIEAPGLEIERPPDGSLAVSFDAVAGASRYNLYIGSLASVRGGAYDHGAGAPAGPFCAATVNDPGGGRLEIVLPAPELPADDIYALVTAHVDDVESPAGMTSLGVEIDRSQSTCM